MISTCVNIISDKKSAKKVTQRLFLREEFSIIDTKVKNIEKFLPSVFGRIYGK